MLLGIKKFDPEEFDGKIPFSMFAGIIEADRKLRDDEKLFLKNFMMSKGGDYKMAADNFGLDGYTLDNNFKNPDLMKEYFMNYFYIVD